MVEFFILPFTIDQSASAEQTDTEREGIHSETRKPSIFKNSSDYILNIKFNNYKID